MNGPQFTCCKCGKAEGISMIFYDRFGQTWCYDCWQERKAEKQARRKARSQRDRSIRALYRQGLKPSEIARSKKITVAEVYKALQK